MAKKTFSCGHKGKGQYCHRCEQEKLEKDKTQFQKQQWNDLFNEDPIDLKVLVNHKLIEKARKIIKSIHQGDCYTLFKGKRMKYDRNIISVPVNNDFRLIYKDLSSGLILQALLSHEEYNSRKPGNKS